MSGEQEESRLLTSFPPELVSTSRSSFKFSDSRLFDNSIGVDFFVEVSNLCDGFDKSVVCGLVKGAQSDLIASKSFEGGSMTECCEDLPKPHGYPTGEVFVLNEKDCDVSTSLGLQTCGTGAWYDVFAFLCIEDGSMFSCGAASLKLHWYPASEALVWNSVSKGLKQWLGRWGIGSFFASVRTIMFWVVFLSFG